MSNRDRKEVAETEPEIRYRMVVTTPAGRSPTPLLGCDPETVEEWAWECVKGTPHLILTAEACAYWARAFYSVHSPEWKQVYDHLHTMPMFFEEG
jgi:hypothetical protein